MANYLPARRVIEVARVLLAGAKLREAAALCHVNRETVTRIKDKLDTLDPGMFGTVRQRTVRVVPGCWQCHDGQTSGALCCATRGRNMTLPGLWLALTRRMKAEEERYERASVRDDDARSGEDDNDPPSGSAAGNEGAGSVANEGDARDRGKSRGRVAVARRSVQSSGADAW